MIVLVCYLDDSGTHKQAPFVTIAGYVAFLEAWEAFEKQALPYLHENNVACLHAKDFYSTNGDFENWKVDQKANFLDGLYKLFRPRVQMGVSMSCLKSQYLARKAESGLGKNQSAYGFAFAAAMNAILRDDTLGRIARWEGISFVLEDGNKNNSGIIESYYRIKKQYEAEFLGSISVVSKMQCAAIQMADLMAFFTRRQTEAMEANNREPIEFDRYLKIMRRGIRDVGHAITDFQEPPWLRAGDGTTL
jgi:hypothetical protein